MERSQNWPDLRSPILNFQDIHFIATVTDINRCNFQWDQFFGVAVTWIQAFSELRSLVVTWWPDLEWPWVWNFHKMCGKNYEQVCKKWRCSAPPLLAYLRKTWGGSSNTPPARRGLIINRQRMHNHRKQDSCSTCISETSISLQCNIFYKPGNLAKLFPHSLARTLVTG